MQRNIIQIRFPFKHTIKKITKCLRHTGGLVVKSEWPNHALGPCMKSRESASLALVGVTVVEIWLWGTSSDGWTTWQALSPADASEGCLQIIRSAKPTHLCWMPWQYLMICGLETILSWAQHHSVPIAALSLLMSTPEYFVEPSKLTASTAFYSK